MAFVSVIVPIYNVKPYIRASVNSILQQTYTDFELLLVDDGSTDGSGEIADEFAVLDPRIRVFHKENGGLSDARNYGLKRAGSPFVTFIDPDDTVESGYLQVLVDLAVLKDVRIAMAGIREVYEIGVPEVNQLPETYKREKVSAAEGFRKCCIREDGIGVSACAKLYDIRLFHDRQFPVGQFYEDLCTIPYLFDQCQSVAWTDLKLYNYLQRDGSTMHHQITEKDLRLFSYLKELVVYADARFPEEHEAAVCRLIEDAFGTVIYRFARQEDFVKVFPAYLEKDRAVFAEGLKNPYVTSAKKMQLRLLLWSPRLYRLFYRTIGKKLQKKRM